MEQNSVYVLDHAPTTLAKACNSRGFGLYELDGRTIITKQELLMAMAEAMRFPDHFGRNWDALADCLTDLEWDQQGGYVVLWSEFERLAHGSERNFTSFIDVMRSATKFWLPRKIDMYLLLYDPTSTRPGFARWHDPE